MDPWERYSADVASRMDAELHTERLGLANELRQAEEASIRLADRLATSIGDVVQVRTRGGDVVVMLVRDCADTWFLGERERVMTLIPYAAIATIRGLPQRCEQRGDRWSISLGSQLRRLMRSGRVVRCVLTCGEEQGRITRVGQNWLELNASLVISLGQIERVDFSSPHLGWFFQPGR